VLPFHEPDIGKRVCDLLDKTGAFDSVYLSGLPEDRGESSEDTQAVAIEPWETTQTERARANCCVC
jgi:hypothetical protein